MNRQTIDRIALIGSAATSVCAALTGATWGRDNAAELLSLILLGLRDGDLGAAVEDLVHANDNEREGPESGTGIIETFGELFGGLEALFARLAPADGAELEEA